MLTIFNRLVIFPLLYDSLFKVNQLPLKSGIWKHFRPLPLCKCRCLEAAEVVLLHQEGNYDCCRAGHASIAMHKDLASVCQSFFHESNRNAEVFRNVLPGYVHHIYDFVLEVRGEAGIQT
jgi:hypothetical protein